MTSIIYSAFKTTKADIEETFLSTVPLRIKNLHHLVKEVGIQRLTSGFLERIANLNEDVTLLIEKWNQDDDWQLLEQRRQQNLRTQISVEVQSRQREQRVRQQEQERVSQREQEKQERVRQREQRVRQQETEKQERVQERVRQRQQLLVEGSKCGCKKCLADRDQDCQYNT